MIFFLYDLHSIIQILLCSQEKCVQVNFYDASAEQMIQIHKMCTFRPIKLAHYRVSNI
jgi:hypothetical protein